MNAIHPKTQPFLLDSISYDGLRQQVLRRDGWRCQACGRRASLEVHHKELRSHSDDHSDENLITLCHDCPHGILWVMRPDQRETSKFLINLGKSVHRRHSAKKHSGCEEKPAFTIRGSSFRGLFLVSN